MVLDGQGEGNNATVLAPGNLKNMPVMRVSLGGDLFPGILFKVLDIVLSYHHFFSAMGLESPKA
jgi:hypothetical protein